MIYKTHTYHTVPYHTVPYRTVPYLTYIFIYIHTHIQGISLLFKKHIIGKKKLAILVLILKIVILSLGSTGRNGVSRCCRTFLQGSVCQWGLVRKASCAMKKNDKNGCFGGIPYFQTNIFSKMTESQVPFFSLCGRAWGRSEPPQSPGKEEHH